ncbi:MAG: MarR family winged helix-turn-helix transcriptional regulator [Alphaproteobacteria bacterium]
MTQTLERKPAEMASIADIAETTAGACLATRVRQLSRIITRVYDDAMRPLGITASQYTLLAQLAARDSITAVEIGHELDIEKSTLSRNLKRLLGLGHIIMDPPAGRRGRGLHLTPKGQAILKDAFPTRCSLEPGREASCCLTTPAGHAKIRERAICRSLVCRTA